MKNKLPDIIEHVGRNQYPNESAGRKRDTLALNFLEPIIYDEAAGTETQPKTEMTARKESKKEADYTAKVSRLSEVETKPIAWLWFNYFALGMLTMISGLPGAGKGFIVAYIISCITRGFPFPDGFTPPKGNVWKVWGKFGESLGKVWGKFGESLGKVWGKFGESLAKPVETPLVEGVDYCDWTASPTVELEPPIPSGPVKPPTVKLPRKPKSSNPSALSKGDLPGQRNLFDGGKP